jgi:hypothetical protein
MNERAQPSENVRNYYEMNNQATGSNTQDRRALNRRDSLANTSLIGPGLVVGAIVEGREKEQNDNTKTRKIRTLNDTPISRSLRRGLLFTLVGLKY